jgi:hypothetical protein
VSKYPGQLTGGDIICSAPSNIAQKLPNIWSELAAKTESPNEIREFGDLERSYTELANNEEWLEHNFDKMVHASDKDRLEGDALPAEEEHILRCLGAAVIMQWNNIPKKLQRELFDNAGSMGDLLSTKDLRGKVARFLHKHKDDEQ